MKYLDLSDLHVIGDLALDAPMEVRDRACSVGSRPTQDDCLR